MLGVGIELSASAVRAVVVERLGQGRAGALALRGSCELPCDTSNPDALTQTLSHVRTTLRVAQPVVLGIPGTAAILTTVRPLVVNPRRSVLAVQFELQQHLPFDLADTAWHYQWLASSNGQARRGGSGLRASGSGQAPPAPSPERFQGAVVAAMRRSLLEGRLSSCRRAGLPVRAVAINPVALLNAVQAQPGGPRAGAIAVLNVTNEPMAEWIVWGGAHLEVVPAASPFPAVAGSSGAGSIGEEALRELGASWETLRQQVRELPKTVWVIGSPELVAQLRDVFAARYGLEFTRADMTRAFGQGANQLEQPDRWAAAIGLALQGVGLSAIPLNLIADTQQDAWSQHVRRATLITSGVCAMATIGFGLNGMMEVRARRTRMLETLERQERLYQSLRPEVQTLLRRQQRLQERSAQLEQLVAERMVLAQVLAQVVAALPDSVWLTKFEGSNDTGVAGMIEGRARSFQDVTRFLDQLKTVAAMTAVKPLSTNVITDDVTKKEVIAFSAQIERKPVPPSPDTGVEHAGTAREESGPAKINQLVKPAKSAKSAKAKSVKP